MTLLDRGRRGVRIAGAALAALGLGGHMLAGAIVALPLLFLPATPAKATCTLSQPTGSFTISGSMLGTEQWVPITTSYTCSGEADGSTTVCIGEVSNDANRGRLYLDASTANPFLAFDSALYLTPSGAAISHGTATGQPSGTVFETSDTNSARTITVYAHLLATTAPPGTTPGTYSFSASSAWRFYASRPSSCGSGGPTGTTAATSAMALSVGVPLACVLNATPTIDFGTINEIGTLASDRIASGAISVTCPDTTSYSIYLGDGANRAGAGAGLRNMANGTARLPYQLYKAADLAAVWDETGMGAGVTGGAGGVTKTATGGADATTLYAAIRAGTILPPTLGTYSDTVLVTVVY
ncbi:spore coat protein U domain-containing protein [Sphingomonas sp. AP4-R1]|uniref:Csu type fimbrial protein n=1 Tax=Sphingomonas sp. AP4-R1 TaxID=2735134 RepID=UPI001493A4B8|nr:spore coat protein U domain-containing protein [Sphingomonas sp. AP4-R1]QJU56992.1 spore coat protein U domain-containing protein [Sphingomonas sp. AP4-R1]